MKTLTVTTARQNLGAWLTRAAKGEAIGIICGAQVIALRPVPIAAADYAEQEYQLTAAELERAARNLYEEVSRAETVPFTGNIADAVAAIGDDHKKIRHACGKFVRGRPARHQRRSPVPA